MAEAADPSSLTIGDLKTGLAELGEAAANEGKVIDLCVYGGSCLMLVSDFRIASQDVDAVAVTNQDFVDRIARDIARRRSWAQDWLNDGVRTYLSPHVEAPEQHILTGTYPSEERPGIRVYVPTAEYMLAMKLMSMRIDAFVGDKDRDDIENLISVVGITSKDELVALAAKYYPEAKTSAKIYLAADSLVHGASEKSNYDHAPKYLGRCGKAGHGRYD